MGLYRSNLVTKKFDITSGALSDKYFVVTDLPSRILTFKNLRELYTGLFDKNIELKNGNSATHEYVRVLKLLALSGCITLLINNLSTVV